MSGKKIHWKQVALTAAMLLAGVGFGAGVAYWLHPDEATSSRSGLSIGFKLLFLLIGIPVSALVAIALHELGHVLGGALVRFRFQSYTVMVFCFYKESGRLKFKWNRDLNTFGGVVMCLPNEAPAEKLRYQFAIYALAGPLMSLLTAGLFYWAYSASQFDESTTGLLLNKLLFFLMLISAALFLVTIFPGSSGGFYTDGARALQLLRGGPVAALNTGLLHTIALSTTGTRPRDLDGDYIRSLLAVPAKSLFKTYLHYYLYLHHLDRNEMVEAGQALQQYLAGSHQLPPTYQAVVKLEEAFFSAVYLDNPEYAAQLAKGLKVSNMMDAHLQPMTEAAIASAQQDWPRAHAMAAEALNLLPNCIDKGAAKFYREQLEEIMRAAKPFFHTAS